MKRFLALFLAALSILVLSPKSLATIENTTNRVTYIGNGSTDTFPYTFKIFANTDLLVTVRDDQIPANETTLVLTTDYTVTGVGIGSGGNVVLVDNDQDWIDDDGDLKSGYTISIRRVRPLTQTTSIRNQGAYYPLLHENAFDHFIMVAQQLQYQLNFAIKKRETDEAGDLLIPVKDDRAEKLFLWDINGAPDAISLEDTVSQGGGLIASNNLSDLTDQTAAQNNLGLGAVLDHLADTNNPHSVTAAQVGNDVAQWNANQIKGVPINDSNIGEGFTLIYNEALQVLEYAPGGGGGGGTLMSAQNVGSEGEGLFKQRIGTTLEFKNIGAGDTNIVVVDDNATNTVKLSLPITSAVVGVSDSQTLSGKTFAQNLLPSVNDTYSLGSSSFRWQDGYFSGTVVVDGDLEVQGTTTTVNTQTLNIEDATVRVNVNGTDASAEGAGLEVEGTDAETLASIGYMDGAASKFGAGAAGDFFELLTTKHAQQISNKTFADALVVDVQTSVTAPSAGKVAIYPKADGKLYYKDSDDNEIEVGSAFSDAENIDYDNGASGLAATNVQQAIDEVAELQASGGWRAFTFDYTDLADSSTTNSAAILNLPAGHVLEAIVLRHTTAFGGGSISAYNVSVGVSGEPERYLTSLDVSEAVDGGVFKSAVFGSGPEHFSSTTSIMLYATSVGDDLDEATAGELTVWVKTSKLP